MMANSLLYKLVSFQGKVSEERFREVYTSKFRKVRIYEVVNVSQKSRQWLADPETTACATLLGLGTARASTPPRWPSSRVSSSRRTGCRRSAKQQNEERARREAEKKEAAAQKAAEKKAAEELEEGDRRTGGSRGP